MSEPSTDAPAVRAMARGDEDAVLAIYGAGIATGHATFTETAGSWQEWDAAHLPEHRYVAHRDGRAIGWVATLAYSRRSVYAGVVEVNVYVDPLARGGGVGRALLTRLLAGTERDGIWTVQAAIFPENAASRALHAAVGFREVGRRERLGLMRHGPMAGRWRDVLLLERRSPVVGGPG